MTRRYAHFLMIALVTVTSVSRASEVIEQGSNSARWIVSHGDTNWASGEYACIVQGKDVAGCGTIIESNEATATIKLSFFVRHSGIGRGDLVARAKAPASRGPASLSVYQPTSSITSTHGFSNVQISVELFGSGVLYSAFASYRTIPSLAFNAGISYLPLTSSALSATYIGIPLSASYLVGDQNNKLELLAGANVVFASSTVAVDEESASASGIGVQPQFGIGYRYWPMDEGIHFRFMLYGIIGGATLISATTQGNNISEEGGFNLWPGLSIGYAF